MTPGYLVPAVAAVPRSLHSTLSTLFFVVDRSVPWAAEFAAVNDLDSARNNFETAVLLKSCTPQILPHLLSCTR
jgi:hypothetical protein